MYEGAEIKNDVQVFERSLIGSCSLVGHKSRLLYGAQVHDNVIIGASTIVGGFIADNCIIGNKCIIYGSLIHKHSNKDTSKWDDIDEIGPTVEDNVFIGWGAIIIGDVKVGKGAVIKANAVVTKDIAPGARYG